MVAKINSIKVHLSLVANLNMSLHQLDIKNVFFFMNSDLEEEVFMYLLLGYEMKLGNNKVCKLKKLLYGLKQFPRAWFESFRKIITSY